MNSETISVNAYTDSPDLHPQWLPGGLQLLCWLLFHPSAWRNYVARLVPSLDADFVLFDLKSEHWQDSGFQRFLLIGYIILPLSVSLIITLVFWTINSPDKIMPNVLAGTTYTVVAAVAVGLTVGVAAGPIYGLVMGLLVGIALPLLGGAAHSLVYSGAASIASSILLSLTSLKPSQSLKKYFVGFAVAVVTTSLLVGLIYNVVSSQLPATSGTVPVESGNVGLLGIIAGVLYGLVYGLIVWQRSNNYSYTLTVGLVFGLGGGLSYSALIRNSPEAFVYNIAAGVAGGLLFAGLFSVPYLFGRYLAGVWAGAIVGTLIAGVSWIPLAPYIFPQTLPNPSEMLLLSLVTILLGLTWIWWRQLLLYPPLMILNLLLYQRDKQLAHHGASYLRFHSAFWDEFQFMPLIGLDSHLLLVAERNPVEGQRAINYLATGRQRRAAQSAQIELFARQLEGCADIQAIRNAARLLTAGDLTGSANSLLGRFRRYSQDVKSALNHDTSYHTLQALNDVSEGLNKLVYELNLTTNPYARRFQPIAVQWHHIVGNQQVKLVRDLEKRQEIDNPYIVGLPLSEKQQEIFVGRSDIIARIKQFLRDGHRTSLLVYGQRRMGKTSLLHNLGRFLPSMIVPLFVDEQGAYGESYADHLYGVSKQMRRSAEMQRGLILPALPHETLVASPFIVFNDWLDEVEQVLDDQDRNMFLLMIDEIEMLKQMTDKKRFDIEDLLSLFRNLIQHRPKFKVVLAGSHTLEEIQQWASYLINLEAVKISYLSTAEALQLIEQPIPNFDLRYEPDASQRVLKLTGGHPYLIQLLCHEIVICKNKQPFEQRYLVKLAEVETAVTNALEVGYLFFANIQQNQVDETGLALLRFLAKQGEDALVSQELLARQVSDNLDQTLAQLQRRDLIETVAGKYRFQVELIRYWFEQLPEQ